MKNKLPVSIFFLLLVFLFSCKKEENKIYYEGGIAPSLRASSTSPLVLTDATKNDFGVRFSWTNPDYRFTSGLSSQDVTYTLEIDLADSNFSSPKKQEAVISKDLSVTYTKKDLNGFLTKMDLEENIPHDIEFRIKSSLASNSVPLFSNSVKIAITPYLDVAVPLPATDELYITGDAVPSSWTNSPPVSQKATPDPSSYTSSGHPTAYSIIMDFIPGKQYKFLSTLGQWQPQYGGTSATGGDIGYNLGGGSDPSAIPTPGEAGSYKVTLNFKTGKYKVEKQ